MATPEFLTALERRGSAPALILAGGRVVDYADLARRAQAFAQEIEAPRALVAMEAAPSEHFVIGLVGALLAGHAVAILPPDAETRAEFTLRFAPEMVWRPTDGRWRLLRCEPAAAVAPHPDLAVLLLTSGSTGSARAVRLSGSALHANATAIADYLGLEASDRAGLTLPLHYSYGLSVLNSHLAVGASVWMPTGPILDEGLVAGLRQQACTNLAGVPFSYELYERVGLRAADLPQLRLMTVAGGRIDAARVGLYDAYLRAKGGRFFVMYGQTEATARIAYLPPEFAARRPGCIGVAIPGGRLGLVDEQGREIEAPESEGELIYRGPNVMMGYAESRTDLARGAELATLATGDIAVRDEQGLFRIVGRKRRMSKIAGVRISHDALETALAAEGIAAAVVGDDEVVVAAYEGSTPAAAVRARLAAASRLPLTRTRAFPVAQLPQLASGKPDYATVRARAGAAANDAHPGVAAAFKEVFHPRRIGPDDSFASLGGDSLRHVELAMMLESLLGHLPARWETMPIAELARPPRDPAERTGARIDPDLLLRAVAIVFVVIHHATPWPIPVGSSAMMVLVGFGLARYQLAALSEGGVSLFLRPLVAVLAPYYAIVAAHTLASGQLPWASLLLIGNFGFADPARGDMLPYLYWFVEVFVQLMLALATAFLIPVVRRTALASPFRFGLALLAVALAARVIGPVLWPLGGRQIFTLPWVLPMAAFGWCAAAAATGRERLLVLGLAAVVLPGLAWHGGNWVGSWVRYGAQFLVLAALMFAPPIRTPARVAAPVLAVAAASYWIYLLHRIVPEMLLAPLQTQVAPAVFVALAVAGGVSIGIGAHVGFRAARRLARSASGGGWRRLAYLTPDAGDAPPPSRFRPG